MAKATKVENKTEQALLLPNLEKEGEFWKLEFNANTISQCAELGFTLKKLQDYDLSKLRVLIFSAFQRHHKWQVKTQEKAIEIWKNYKFPDEDGEHNPLINKGITKLLKLYEQELGIIPNESAIVVEIEGLD